MEFKDRDLEAFWNDPDGNPPRRIPSLEKLQHDRAGQYSIRVNDQWRLCFMWTPEGAKGVEFCDYH